MSRSSSAISELESSFRQEMTLSRKLHEDQHVEMVQQREAHVSALDAVEQKLLEEVKNVRADSTGPQSEMYLSLPQQLQNLEDKLTEEVRVLKDFLSFFSFFFQRVCGNLLSARSVFGEVWSTGCFS